MWSEQRHVTQLLPAARQRISHCTCVRSRHTCRLERGMSRAAHLRVDATSPGLITVTVELDEPDRKPRLLDLTLGAGEQRERDTIIDLLRAPRNVQLPRVVERTPRPLGLRRRDDCPHRHRPLASYYSYGVIDRVK